MDRKEIEQAGEIVRRGRKEVTWNEESSKEYNNALDTLLSFAQQELDKIDPQGDLIRQECINEIRDKLAQLIEGK